MFEYWCMILNTSGGGQGAAVAELQQRITEAQGPRLDDRALPTLPGLAPLLPGGALRRGSSYAVRGSWQLALSCLAAASSEGAWCGVIGCESFGAEAAVQLGVALDRCVLVPHLGANRLNFAGSLAEVLTVIVIAMPAGKDHAARQGEAARLAAKLREHGAALIVAGSWPGSESELMVTGARWHGLGEGNGMLDTCDLTVQSHDRRGTRQHTVSFAGGALVDPGHAPVQRLRAR